MGKKGKGGDGGNRNDGRWDDADYDPERDSDPDNVVHLQSWAYNKAYGPFYTTEPEPTPEPEAKVTDFNEWKQNKLGKQFKDPKGDE